MTTGRHLYHCRILYYCVLCMTRYHYHISLGFCLSVKACHWRERASASGNDRLRNGTCSLKIIRNLYLFFSNYTNVY